jgi:hypothetical protein
MDKTFLDIVVYIEGLLNRTMTANELSQLNDLIVVIVEPLKGESITVAFVCLLIGGMIGFASGLIGGRG